MYIKVIIAIFCMAFKFASIANGACCSEEGVNLGLFCRCRQSCTGSGCTSGSGLGITADCGNGVCCCGNPGTCTKPERPDLDDCLTEDPTIDPTTDPTKNPTKSPTSDPTNDPTTDPTNVPTNNPTTEPTIQPTTEPTLNPVIVCDVWTPDTLEPTSAGGGGGNGDIPPIPDPSSFELCQLGRSGDFSLLDKYYSFDCSCYDAQTITKLSQLIQQWFDEFNINFNEGEEGRFEQWYQNYAEDNIFFQTSFNASPSSPGSTWSDLESLTSCDPNNPGYPLFIRTISQTLEFKDIPGGVLIKKCVDNGNIAIGQVKSDTYRIRDNEPTENIVAIGTFTLERQDGTNIWLIKEIGFVAETVGFLS